MITGLLFRLISKKWRKGLEVETTVRSVVLLGPPCCVKRSDGKKASGPAYVYKYTASLAHSSSINCKATLQLSVCGSNETSGSQQTSIYIFFLNRPSLAGHYQCMLNYTSRDPKQLQNGSLRPILIKNRFLGTPYLHPKSKLLHQ